MNRFAKSSYLLLIYLLFYLPIAILIAYSFNDSQYSLVWKSFTLDWYRQLLSDTDLQTVTLHSLIVGVTAATAAAILGTLAAISLYRYRFHGKNLLYGLIFILILSPDIVMGISLLILFSTLKISLGFTSLLLAHITFCLPFVAVTVYSRIVTLDKNIFEAARDLGATEFTIVKKIIVPLLWPAIIVGWLLSFTLSLDDVVISFFVTGPTFNILPLQIFSMLRLGINPEINALCTVLFILTLIIVLTTQLLMRKK